MKIIRISFLLFTAVTLTNCASGYQTIQPRSLNYVSNHETDDVKLEYKYDLLDKKYAKKELKKGVKLVSVKITNNTANDLVLGDQINLAYENDSNVLILENDKVFKTLKQSPATYLFYLLLTPVTLSVTRETNNSLSSQSFPLGLVVGPGLAAGHLIASSSANKKFKKELLDYSIYGTVIPAGETKYGLIGIKTDTFDALKLRIQ